jgi:hypothetical protein
MTLAGLATMFRRLLLRWGWPKVQDAWDATVVWLPVGHPENPFQHEVIDCRTALRSFAAVAPRDPVAEGAARAREAVRQEVLDSAPSRAMAVDCHVCVPCSNVLADGPVFVSAGLEHRWEIHVRDGQIHCRRSRTGQLVHVATFEHSSNGLTIRRVRSDRSAVHNNPSYALAELKFLLDSCVAWQPAAFPIAPGISRTDVRTIAIWGWQTHGPLALFGRMLEDSERSVITSASPGHDGN